MIVRRLLTPALAAAAAAAALTGCGSDTTAQPATTSTPAASASDSASPTAPSAPAPARLSPADLQQRWWAWAAGTTEEQNPVVDPTGKNCGVDQPADVFFLAGTFGGDVARDCVVPAGRPLAFPILNLYGSRADCKDFLELSEGSATVDGAAVTPERYTPTPLSIETVEGNPLNPDGGKVTALACGLWVQLAPLAAGKHEVAFEGRSGDFRLSVAYHLTVS